MNYLAHAYLSFSRPDILAGNMISDFVKGKKKYGFSTAIQQGIALHREIDAFTDNHAATSAAKKFFQVPYRLYSGVFIDVVFDHFLATDTSVFPDAASLFRFAQQTYKSLQQYQDVFPLQFKAMFPYMRSQNWLYNYRHNEGIRNSFGGIARRALYLTETDIAFAIFETNYLALKACYDNFFPGLQEFTRRRLQLLDE